MPVPGKRRRRRLTVSNPSRFSQKLGLATLEDALQHAFFPLTLPLTVGPGAISVAITLGAHLRYQGCSRP